MMDIVNTAEVFDEEILAVITAVIAASLNKSTHDLIVRPLACSAFTARPWNQISRQEQMASRL